MITWFLTDFQQYSQEIMDFSEVVLGQLEIIMEKSEFLSLPNNKQKLITNEI